MELFQAIDKRDVELTKKLLSEGAEVNQVHKWLGITPLALAVQKCNTEIVKLLIAHGADVSAKQADVIGSSGMVEKAGHANPILSEAALHTSAEITKLLLEAGAEVNAKSSGGYTALLVAGGRVIQRS